jgi:SOS-response transcriptional repressor LexA
MRLTPTQRTVLLAVAYERQRQGWPPILRDLLRPTGLRSTNSVGHHLARLRDMGLVDWVPNASRTLHLTTAGKEAVG